MEGQYPHDGEERGDFPTAPGDSNLTGSHIDNQNRGNIPANHIDKSTPEAQELEMDLEPSDPCHIYLETLSDPGILQPCGHSFDIDCILRWMAESEPALRSSPLDGGPITELKHAATERQASSMHGVSAF
jgi:hypothetical protein